jgi:hypothetical protein
MKLPSAVLACSTAICLSSGSAIAKGQLDDLSVGDLICSLGHASVSDNVTDGVPSQKIGMVCLFRTLASGVEETYSGSLRVVQAGKQSLANKTVLWHVKAKPEQKIRVGLLAQRYASQSESPSTKRTLVRGDRDKVGLELQTEAKPQNTVLVEVELHLKSSFG